jgi:Alginate lyase
MTLFIKSSSLFLILLLSTQCSKSLVIAQNSKPITIQTATNRQLTFLDFNKISKVKASIKEKNSTYAKAYDNLIKLADKALKTEITSVVQKTQTPPSGDKHDYLSLAPYFWPDSTKADGLPWIRKDGQVNPLTRGKNVDEPTKDVMMTSAKNLTYAFYFSDDKKYATRAIQVLQTWFVNEETKMNPHLNYGQGIPGVNTGRGFGIIEFTGVLEIISAIEMLRLGNALDEKTDKALTKWLSDYVNWMQTSKIGLAEKATTNNHGTWYDTQVVAILLFLKRDDEAKAVLETFKKRIDHQIEADGKQPEELARTKALSYSTMNLTAFTNIAYLGKTVNVDLWNYTTPKGGGIKKAYNFLKPYAMGEKAWDYPQIGGHLAEDIERLKGLFIKTGSMMDVKEYAEMASQTGDKTNWEVLIRP